MEGLVTGEELDGDSRHWNVNLLALLRNHAKAEGERARYVVLEGGARSGKTQAVCEYLASVLWQWPGCAAGCFRQDATRHRDGAMRDFRAVLQRMGMADAVAEHRTGLAFEFPNGATLSFRGTQDAMRLHGPAWDVAWFNEAMEVSRSAFDQIDQRTRHAVLIDFNPSLTRHWTFDALQKMGAPRVEWVRSTFRDNPHLEPGIVEKIAGYEPTEENAARGTADRWLWEVYGLGVRGRREGLVFPKWSMVREWPERHACRAWGYGLDFGFAADPCALVECALHNAGLYVRQRVYETGLIVGRCADRPSVPSLVGAMEELQIDRHARIHADCAAAESIRVLALAGWNAVPSVKKATVDGTLHGLDRVRSFPLFVHEESVDVQRELENYAWARDRSSGAWLARPADSWNHAMDAIRYWATAEAGAVRDAQARAHSRTAATPLGKRRF